MQKQEEFNHLKFRGHLTSRGDDPEQILTGDYIPCKQLGHNSNNWGRIQTMGAGFAQWKLGRVLCTFGGLKQLSDRTQCTVQDFLWCGASVGSHR